MVFLKNYIKSTNHSLWNRGKSKAVAKKVNNTQTAPKQNILSESNMKQLSQIKAQVATTSNKGMPVWDTAASGNKCDCAVGECDCNGSIWQ